MYKGPSIDAERLLEHLYAEDIIEPSQLTSLLGVERNKVTLLRLETALTRENILADSHLAKIKGKIASKRYVADPSIATKPVLSKNASLDSGAVVLDMEPLTVAMIEDTPENVNKLVASLNVQGFDIWLCTAGQFVDLHKGCYGAGVKVTESKPPVEDIFEIFDSAIKTGASDVHLSVGQPPILRLDGKLKPMNRQPLDNTWLLQELTKVMGEELVNKALRDFDADMAYSYGSTRLRLNAGADRHGLTLSARTLPTRIPTMDDLGLPRAIRSFVNLDRGLILVTGPTGSGKSTTLASLLNSLALEQSRHIITLEDPIEFHLPQGKSMVNQRELHKNFTSFPSGLRQALRQDPDVILVGEMRDLDTIRTAVTAAETGHLVFGTLHTFDAPSSVARIVSIFDPSEQNQVRQQLSYVLKGIVSQTLVKTSGGAGRMAAFEIMTSTHAVSANLRKLDGHTALRQTIESSSEQGMQTMDMALAELVTRGRVSKEAALEKARDHQVFESLLESAGSKR